MISLIPTLRDRPRCLRRAILPILLGCVVPSRGEVLIDCGDDDDGASLVQDGWTGLTGPTFSASVPPVSVALTPIGAVTLDDRNRATNGGGVEPEFWSDFIFANGSLLDGSGIEVAITGLQPTTFYPLTLWGFDKVSVTTRSAEWFANDGGGPFLPKGEITFDGNSIAPESLGDYALNLTITTNAAGAITLRGIKSTVNGLATSHNVFLTGLRIGDAIPTAGPTNITISTNQAPSGAPIGSTVATFTGASTVANDTFTFAMVAGEGDTFNGLFTIGGAGQQELQVASPLDPYIGQAISFRVRATNSQALTLEKSFLLTIIEDSEPDGLPDPWESMFWPDLGLGVPDADDDADTLNNLAELARGSSPLLADTDGDTLSDAVETKTGTFVSLQNTGTDPARADTDGDGFEDAQENPLLPTLGLNQPGTDPNVPDSDADGYGDRFELAWPSDPKNQTSLPLPQGLLVDFSNAGNQAAGPQIMNGYQSYIANHEVIGEVDHSQAFTAFGTSVTLTVEYPDSVANTVRQMINRADANNLNYIGEQVALVRDWIGIDARFAQGGNGFDIPTTMTFAFDGLPAGQYQYRAYHHDTEFQHGMFNVAVEDAAGSREIGTFAMTASTNHATNNPSPINPGAGQGPGTLDSTVTFTFQANGTNPVVIRYSNFEAMLALETFLGVNGFELTALAAPTPLVWVSVTRNAQTGAINLVWQSEAGGNYLVQGSQSLAIGDWGQLGAVQATGTTASFVDVPPAGTLVRHYRIVRP